MYKHIKESERRGDEKLLEAVKLICSYIDPKRAYEQFGTKEVTDNVGFFDDLKALDPNFDPKNFDDVLGDEE